MMYAGFIIITLLAVAVIAEPLYARKDSSFTQHRITIACIVAFFLLGSLGLYGLFGSPGVVRELGERETQLASLKKSIAEESDAIKANPDDLGAWVRLGQSFMAAGQYKGAENAFRHAVVVSKGNPLLLVAYASAMISGADGKITDDAKKALEMVLLQQPQNPEARYLLAVRLLQDGNYKEAMKSMKSLYASLPEDSPFRAMIDRQIGRK